MMSKAECEARGGHVWGPDVHRRPYAEPACATFVFPTEPQKYEPLKYWEHRACVRCNYPDSRAVGFDSDRSPATTAATDGGSDNG